MSPTVYNVMNKKFHTNKKLFNKMIFIMNALEHGWKIKKVKHKGGKYVFYKRIDDISVVTNDSFLESFVKDSMSLDKLKFD